MAKLKGQVVSVTNNGDLVTDLDVKSLQLAPRDESLQIECEGHRTNGLYAADHQQPEMTFLAFENSNGLIQICIVGGDASGFLSIKSGADVLVSW